MYFFAIILLALLLYVLLAVIGIYFAYSSFNDPFVADRKDFLQLAGIALTFVTALMASVISLLNSAATFRNSVKLEAIKPLLSIEYTAFREMNGAALRYYDALARLETNSFDLSYIEECEKEMKRSYDLLFFMPEAYREAWFDFWQNARNLKEFVIQEITANPQFQQQNFWKSSAVGRLAEPLNRLIETTPRRKLDRL